MRRARRPDDDRAVMPRVVPACPAWAIAAAAAATIRGGGPGPTPRPPDTLRWDLLHRHRRRLSGDLRMSLAHRTLNRPTPDERAGVARRGAAPREGPR